MQNESDFNSWFDYDFAPLKHSGPRLFRELISKKKPDSLGNSPQDDFFSVVYLENGELDLTPVNAKRKPTKKNMLQLLTFDAVLGSEFNDNYSEHKRSMGLKRDEITFNRVIVVPEDVVCNIRISQIEVIGPLGTLYIDTEDFFYLPRETEIELDEEGNKTRPIPFHFILESAIKGVSFGHICKVKICGTGYKVTYLGDRYPNNPIEYLNQVTGIVICPESVSLNESSVLMSVRLGFHEEVHIVLPDWIKVANNRHGQVLFGSISHHRLGSFVENFRCLRPLSPYRRRGMYIMDSKKTPRKFKLTRLARKKN